MLKQLEYLFKLARERKIRPKDKSYTNQLLKDKILSKEKVEEEIEELINFVKSGDSGFLYSNNSIICFPFF